MIPKLSSGWNMFSVEVTFHVRLEFIFLMLAGIMPISVFMDGVGEF